MCKQCRDEHQKSPETESHEVVPYKQRKRKLPKEKCKDHPSKDIDMICENCQVPLCSKCAIQNHRGHMFADLETIYSKNFIMCLDEIYNINQFHLPISEEMKRDIKEDGLKMKTYMDKIRASIKAEAESLILLVKKAMSDNLEQANRIEKTLLEKLRSQDKTYNEYNDYLENIAKKFQCYLSFDSVQNNPIIFSFSENLKMKSMPETTKLVFPVFTGSQYSQDDVAKLLGNITVPNTKPENRETTPMETSSTVLKPTGKQKKWKGKKHTLSLSFCVTEVWKYTVPGDNSNFHLSPDQSGRLWVSNKTGYLIQTDLKGSMLLKIKTNGEVEGYHTVTLDAELIYTDKKKNVISRITQDYIITEFIKTGDWKPISIHSSHINKDILVGMSKDWEGKVTRYNKTGIEIQNIQRDIKGLGLYSRNPHYITENINGDVCVSDLDKNAVAVVNKSGQHRFYFTGHGSVLRPFGICTDILGHILVCDINVNAVHLLNKNGQFLSMLLTSEHNITDPRSACVDNENNLHMGQNGTNMVTVYKYLQ